MTCISPAGQRICNKHTLTFVFVILLLKQVLVSLLRTVSGHSLELCRDQPSASGTLSLARECKHAVLLFNSQLELIRWPNWDPVGPSAEGALPLQHSPLLRLPRHSPLRGSAVPVFPVKLPADEGWVSPCWSSPRAGYRNLVPYFDSFENSIIACPFSVSTQRNICFTWYCCLGRSRKVFLSQRMEHIDLREKWC